jgi:hypothetical protein
MHRKHPGRLPKPDHIPGPDSARARHVWSWDTRRNMRGERRHRVYQVVEATPTGHMWAQVCEANEPAVKVPTYAMVLRKVRKFGPGKGFAMGRAPLTFAGSGRPVTGKRPRATGPAAGTFSEHIQTCTLCGFWGDIHPKCETGKQYRERGGGRTSPLTCSVAAVVLLQRSVGHATHTAQQRRGVHRGTKDAVTGWRKGGYPMQAQILNSKPDPECDECGTSVGPLAKLNVTDGGDRYTTTLCVECAIVQTEGDIT